MPVKVAMRMAKIGNTDNTKCRKRVDRGRRISKIKLKKRKISKIKIPKQNETTHTQREAGRERILRQGAMERLAGY